MTFFELIKLLSAPMNIDLDNETWLIELGDGVIEKKAKFGINTLTDYEAH